MRYILLLLISIFFISESRSQEAFQQVTIGTEIPKANVAIYDISGNIKAYGRTPFVAGLALDSTYSYQIRHRECHADSGILHIDTSTVKIDIPIRPYRVQINWEVSPANVHFSMHNTKIGKVKYKGIATGDTLIRIGQYKLKLSATDYRSYHHKFAVKSDTIITISHRLQYCPRHFIVALNAGLASEQAIPIGLSLSYGGAHSFYLRYQQTLLHHAKGKDLAENSLMDVLSFPYRDCSSEYLSAVCGYQYLTPRKFVLQLGAGYGKQSFNWKSSADNKRHTYSPDTRQGIILDFGLGYVLNNIYLGASGQALSSNKKGLNPSSISVNVGVVL